jgi:uncharacterized protein (DUF2336 family)
MAAFTLVAEELEEAIAHGTSQKRIETLRRVTDLFVSGAEQFSEEQVELFDEVIGRLADQIEARARAELSDRLAEIGNAPIKVLTDLASDDVVEVAKPILTYSTRLDDQTLIGIAKTKSQHHLLAISQRVDISEPITDLLVTRGNQQVLRTVAQNAGAKFSDCGFGVLVEKSKADETLATHVGLRKDIPKQHMTKLIERASETVRRKLAAASPIAAAEIERVLAEIKARMKAENAPPARDYGPAKAMVAQMRKAGQFGEQQVRVFAQGAKFEETVVSLALLCGISVETVEHIMLQEKSDVPLVLARAAGLSWLTTKVILMLQSSGSGVSEQDLAVAKDNFEKLQPATAQRVIRFHQVRQNAGKG